MALWFPYLPAERIRKRLSHGSAKPDGEQHPLVIVAKDHGALTIRAMDQKAAGLGFQHGLTLADARARVPLLDVEALDEAADQALLHRFAGACEIFTPLVACDDHDTLMLDITGCSHLFDGEERMHHAVARIFTRAGYTLRATISGTPDSARALARFGHQQIIIPGDEAQAAHDLPVMALECNSATITALGRAGLKTLGDLASRPGRILAARFGPALVTKLLRILGHEDIRITPLRAPPECCAEKHFAEPLMLMDSLLGALTRLAQEVCAIMEQQGLGGRRFETVFFRSDGAVRRITLETAAAGRDPHSLMRLFRLRMDTLADPLDPGFGFDALRLSVLQTEPIASHQNELDGKAQDQTSLDDLIARLITRFGQERVLRFIGRDTHDPRRVAACVSVLSGSVQVDWHTPERGEPPLRPLSLFDAPQPIEVVAEVPDGPPLRFRWRRLLHEVARAEGPERIAPEWWLPGADMATRDYYRIESADGHRFWVFREGFYDQGARPRWYMHGLFA